MLIAGINDNAAEVNKAFSGWTDGPKMFLFDNTAAFTPSGRDKIEIYTQLAKNNNVKVMEASFTEIADTLSHLTNNIGTFFIATLSQEDFVKLKNCLEDLDLRFIQL